jgi:excisionase family DNA binding protein
MNGIHVVTEEEVGAETVANPELLSLVEAAERANVSLTTVRGWLRRGRLPSTLIGHRRFVRPDDLDEAQLVAHVGHVVPAWRREPRRAGKRLRALREAAGLSQLQLAAVTGLSHEAISRLEKGNKAPYAETIRLFSRALRVSPEQFVSRESLGLTMLTTKEAAGRLGVPVGRVQTWLQEGELPGWKVSGQWRIQAVAVRELGRSGRLRGRSRRLDPRYHG